MPYMSDEVLAQLAHHHATMTEHVYLQISLEDALDLAVGFVPRMVRMMARTIVEWEDLERQWSQRPVRGRSIPVTRGRKRAEGTRTATGGARSAGGPDANNGRPDSGVTDRGNPPPDPSTESTEDGTPARPRKRAHGKSSTRTRTRQP